MDEPFGALDALTRDFLQDEIARIWEQEHKTAILITHSIENDQFTIHNSQFTAPLTDRWSLVTDNYQLPITNYR